MFFTFCSLSNKPTNQKFRIDSKTGVLTATSHLAVDKMSIFHVEVIAKDRGSPPMSSTGLVKIKVDGGINADILNFEKASYSIKVAENTVKGSQILRVRALRSDNRRETVIYSFGSGHEDDAFEINAATGVIKVKDPSGIDYERIQDFQIIVVAHVKAEKPLYAYTNVHVQITDENDNSPRFTQDQYLSSVWEGNNKGTYVIQVSATDDDIGRNGDMLYYIVDGNHDDAFVIDPPFSGIVKTNIVLDREIRETYRYDIQHFSIKNQVWSASKLRN